MNNLLGKKIREAEASKGYLITITTFNPSKKGKELEHWYITNNFPRLDIPASMDGIKRILEKESIQLSSSFKKS